MMAATLVEQTTRIVVTLPATCPRAAPIRLLFDELAQPQKARLQHWPLLILSHQPKINTKALSDIEIGRKAPVCAPSLARGKRSVTHHEKALMNYFGLQKPSTSVRDVWGYQSFSNIVLKREKLLVWP